jgi:hypothetical protein
MGHGMAVDILRHGFDLRVMVHRIQGGERTS